MSSTPKVELKMDWCSFEAAKYAVEHWHYSHSMPAGKRVQVGAWEGGKFVGVIVYSLGANRHIGGPYGVTRLEACELTRIALTKHVTPVSRMIAISIKLLKKKCPGLKVVVSYADSNQSHHGGIYQAAGWYYTGEFASERGIILRGKLTHRRSVNAKYNTSDMQWLRTNVDPKAIVIEGKCKYKYVYPLTEEIRDRLETIKKPYPKRAASIDGDASSIQGEEGGSNPTAALYP